MAENNGRLKPQSHGYGVDRLHPDGSFFIFVYILLPFLILPGVGIYLSTLPIFADMMAQPRLITFAWMGLAILLAVDICIIKSHLFQVVRKSAIPTEPAEIVDPVWLQVSFYLLVIATSVIGGAVLRLLGAFMHNQIIRWLL